MSAHTPGPWSIEPREVMEDRSVYPEHIIGGPEGHLVCFTEAQCVAKLAIQHPGEVWGKSPIRTANARLIAAAPELLEALKEARRAIGEHFAPTDCYATGPATGDPIRDLVQCPACTAIAMHDRAIAKAQGVS